MEVKESEDRTYREKAIFDCVRPDAIKNQSLALMELGLFRASCCLEYQADKRR